MATYKCPGCEGLKSPHRNVDRYSPICCGLWVNVAQQLVKSVFFEVACPF